MPSKDFRSGWQWGLSCKAGRWPNGDEAEKGIAQIRQGLAAWQATGAEMYVPLFLGALAQAYAQGGQAEEGLRVIAEALAMVEKNGERWNEAELYRLKGELILQKLCSHQFSSCQLPTPDL